jgi:hypothetical protein
MENSVKEIVNLGIGIYKAGEETVQTSFTSAASFFNEIKLKGETNTSEQANQLRELVSKALRDLSQIETNAKTSFEEFSKNLNSKYNEIATQIDGSIPDSVKESIQAALDQIKTFLESASPAESNTVAADPVEPTEAETNSKKGKSKIKAA